MKKFINSHLKKISLFAFTILFFNANLIFAISDKPSIHGMLMVGVNSIYLSHLPMFHAPHDYQVIIEVSLDGQGDPTQKYKEDRLISKENIYTLVPDNVFILPEKIQNKESFAATIYRGHFERGGIPIIKNVKVNINNVIYFKKFEKKLIIPIEHKVIIFGNSTEQFIAHNISACPDFDQVLAIDISSSEVLGKVNLIQLNLKDQKNSIPLQENKTYVGQNALNPKSEITFKVKKQFYLEFDDLVCHM